jgi:hypothetical protein
MLEDDPVNTIMDLAEKLGVLDENVNPVAPTDIWNVPDPS